MLGSRRVIPGSSSFSGGAGCIPMSYHSLHAKAGARLLPQVLGCRSSGLSFPSARSPGLDPQGGLLPVCQEHTEPAHRELSTGPGQRCSTSWPFGRPAASLAQSHLGGPSGPAAAVFFALEGWSQERGKGEITPQRVNSSSSLLLKAQALLQEWC